MRMSLFAAYLLMVFVTKCVAVSKPSPRGRANAIKNLVFLLIFILVTIPYTWEILNAQRKSKGGHYIRKIYNRVLQSEAPSSTSHVTEPETSEFARRRRKILAIFTFLVTGAFTGLLLYEVIAMRFHSCKVYRGWNCNLNPQNGQVNNRTFGQILAIVVLVAAILPLFDVVLVSRAWIDYVRRWRY
jgi:hypothetical protein